MANILTFRFLRELQKQERTTKELEKLDTDFYKQVASYMEKKMGLDLKDNADFASKRDLDHTKIIIKDILNRRERKVINLAMLNARGNILPQNILPEEKELFEKITTGVKKYRSTLEFIFYDDHDENNTTEKKETIKDNTTEQQPKKENIDTDDSNKDTDKNDDKQQQDTDTIKITILDNVPQFMAADGKSYGPFKKDDIVDIPTTAATLLIKIKKAEQDQ
ncbi:MAG: DNA replication complex GINS family protein [Candidatus Aenigmarchaeota archaeon]|nr:DNA replication complex GINS family protein [Candidatus Aenigmarchaeota archaeon]